MTTYVPARAGGAARLGDVGGALSSLRTDFAPGTLV